jgi:hypothetical protein
MDVPLIKPIAVIKVIEEPYQKSTPGLREL